MEFCRKALVNISIELYLIYLVSDYCIEYVHNDLISDFSIFVIQIDIFADMIFKFITSEATIKFWNHILFFIISIRFVLHQVHIYVWGFSMLLLLGLIPVASHGRLLHSQHARVLLWGISPHTAYNQTKKCQITKIKLVLLARNHNYSAKQRNPKPVLHIT